MVGKAIHICPVGYYSEPILAVLGSEIPCDVFYFLYNKHEKSIKALNEVEETLKKAGFTDLNRVEINPFEYNDVITNILNIHRKEFKQDNQTKFFINFTSGTNIVAGACCSSSYFIGATLYYVMDSRVNPDSSKGKLVRKIIVPKIPDLEKMNSLARLILSTICENSDGISISELSKQCEISPQNLNHYLNVFSEGGMIFKERIGRRVIVNASDQGKMFSSWTKDSDYE